jgi:hypothetical protein
MSPRKTKEGVFEVREGDAEMTEEEREFHVMIRTWRVMAETGVDSLS